MNCCDNVIKVSGESCSESACPGLWEEVPWGKTKFMRMLPAHTTASSPDRICPSSSQGILTGSYIPSQRRTLAGSSSSATRSASGDQKPHSPTEKGHLVHLN